MTDLATPLARVIAQVESSTRPSAIRFEEAMFDRGVFQIPIFNAITTANQCSKQTSQMIYCTSWGLFQIMGFNLYSPTGIGLALPIQQYWWDAEMQLATFNQFCKMDRVDPATFDFTSEATLEHFARAYNGPGDIPNYVAKMKAAYANLPPVAGV
jgi:hypothetical protein